MNTIYLDHNIIDGFDKEETTYIAHLLANKGILPVISLASIDEIFRGGSEARSRSNIDSLKKLGVRYIHTGPDESYMSISDLDYVDMHQKWLKIQSDTAILNNSHYLFVSALFHGNISEAIQDMDQAISDQITWMNSNDTKFINLQTQFGKLMSNAQEYRGLCKQLLYLKKLLPFTAKEINNIQERSVFWYCVDKLKNSADANLQLIGNCIENEIDGAKMIVYQFTIVFQWLNLFGYYPDDLTQKNRVRSNSSDANHATYAIACDAMLTLDKRFAKRTAAAMGALKLKTKVSTDVNELLSRITGNGEIRGGGE